MSCSGVEVVYTEDGPEYYACLCRHCTAPEEK